jgi:ethanolamine utilization protein EutA (predicted chaperonin)
MVAWILVGVLCLTVGGLGFLLVRATRRLFQYDELFDLIMADLINQIKRLDKMLGTDIGSESPEVAALMRELLGISKRIEVYAHMVNQERQPKKKLNPKTAPWVE